MQLQRLQPRMRKIERDGDGRHTFRGEPLVAQVTLRAEAQSSRSQLVVELLDARLQLASGNRDAQIADAPLEQLVIFKSYPGRLDLWLCGVMPLHGFHRSAGSRERSEPRRMTDRRSCSSRCSCRTYTDSSAALFARSIRAGNGGCSTRMATRRISKRSQSPDRVKGISYSIQPAANRRSLAAGVRYVGSARSVASSLSRSLATRGFAGRNPSLR